MSVQGWFTVNNHKTCQQYACKKNPEIYWTELSPANLLRLFQFSLVAGHLAKIRGEVKQTKIISQLSQNQLETTKLTLIENTSLEMDMRNECVCLRRQKILGHLQTPPTPGHDLRCREGAPSVSQHPNLNQVSRVKSYRYTNDTYWSSGLREKWDAS